MFACVSKTFFLVLVAILIAPEEDMHGRRQTTFFLLYRL